MRCLFLFAAASLVSAPVYAQIVTTPNLPPVSTPATSDFLTLVQPCATSITGYCSRRASLGQLLSLSPSGITQLTGDITTASGSGSQAATIAPGAVTGSKLYNTAVRDSLGYTPVNPSSLGSLATQSAVTAAQLPTFTGDVVNSPSGVMTLANSGVTAGTYGGTAMVAVPTVNAKGLVTSVATASITPSGIGALPAISPTAATPNFGTTLAMVNTAYVAAHNACRSILDYGADPTGQAANDTAYQNALAAGGANPCVEFPQGRYVFSANEAYTLSGTNASVVLEGAADGTSQLIWNAAGGGLTFNGSDYTHNVHLRNLTFVGGAAGSGTAITLNDTRTTISNPAQQALSDISNVTVRGSGGPNAGSAYWNGAVLASGMSNVNFINDAFWGNSNSSNSGVTLQGASSSAQEVVYNFVGDTINFFGSNIVYGNWVQGVSISQSNLITTGTCVNVSGTSGPDQLSITTSQFACGTAVKIAGGLVNTLISNNMFASGFSNPTNIDITGSGLTTIVGNTFGGPSAANPNGTGIHIRSTNGFPTVISGNACVWMAACYQVDAGSSLIFFSGNAYSGNTANRSVASGATVTVMDTNPNGDLILNGANYGSSLSGNFSVNAAGSITLTAPMVNAVASGGMNVNGLRLDGSQGSQALGGFTASPGQHIALGITVNGAVLGDYGMCAMSINPGGLSVSGQVTATNSVECDIDNNTSSSITVGSYTMYARAIHHQ